MFALMVVQLKRTLNEKIRKLTDKNKIDSKKKENQDRVNNIIKMVVINTAVGVLLKVPAAVIPLLNLYAEFYYYDYKNQYLRPAFGDFYTVFFSNGFYGLFVDCLDFLYAMSIVSQVLIYFNFDNKLRSGFNLLGSSKTHKNKI